jgi:hypothetical protein
MRVLVIDWDLEAPGLHRYFSPFMVDKDLKLTEGLIEFLSTYIDEALTSSKPDENTGKLWHEPFTDILVYAESIKWHSKDKGTIDFVSSGLQSPTYATRVNLFDWQNFYDRFGGGKFLEAVKEKMRAEYDYVLIDSRTGVSDTSGICTVQMPDSLVLLFTANNQSILGAAGVAASVSEQWLSDLNRQGNKEQIFPVLTRTERVEKVKLNDARRYARLLFAPFLHQIAKKNMDDYWGQAEIPYYPYYAYEEILAVFGDEPNLRESLLTAIEQILSYLTGGTISKLIPPTPAERKNILSEFERQTGSKKTYKIYVATSDLDKQVQQSIIEDAITMAGMAWHGMKIITDSKQPTVEERQRLAGEADLMVGIVSQNFEWDPDHNKLIIEMEYDAAIERLMFQLEQPLSNISESELNSRTDDLLKQDIIEAFKKRYSDHRMPILFNMYTLGPTLLNALNSWRVKHESLPEQLRPEKIHAYREKLKTLHSTLPAEGFVTRLNVRIDIDDIYVPLNAMFDLRGISEDTFADSAHAERELEKSKTGFDIQLAEVFRQSRERGKKGVVILGDPGSGKTTHLKRLLLQCLRKEPETTGLPSKMLPVFLPLRDLAEHDQGLDAFIRKQLDVASLKTPAGFGEKLLERGNLLLLLDGLDEVADISMRERITKWIGDALRDHPSCRFVVTCRFAGYIPTVRFGEDFLEMHIRPLNADQVSKFIYNWYQAVEKGLAQDLKHAEKIGREKAESLIETIQKEDFRAQRIYELTCNPLLLSNLCLVHRHRGELPQKRVRLYEECIDVLLEHWQKAKKLSVRVTAREGRRALQPAALWLHRKENRTRAKGVELAPQIEPALKATNWQGGSAMDFLRTIRDESGLLTG